jgi:hypothetical protein
MSSRRADMKMLVPRASSQETSLSFCLLEWRKTISRGTDNQEYAPDGKLCVQHVHAFDTDHTPLSTGEYLHLNYSRASCSIPVLETSSLGRIWNIIK